MSEMSGAEVPDDTGLHPLNPATLGAYQAAFAAIADGWNRKAARLLRDLSPERLAELHVICGDVQIMVEAEQRRRAGEQ
jgi:hypothetical protein